MIPDRSAWAGPLRPVLLATLVSLAACAGEPDEAAIPAGFDDAPTIPMEATLRIGDVDDPDLGFSRIGSMAVAPDGRLFVVEGQDLEIRVFGPDGTRIATMGRRGEGPGEFGSPPTIGVWGDTVWALDGFFGARLSLFRTDGTPIQTRRVEAVTLPLAGGSGSIGPVGVTSDGRLVGGLRGIRYDRSDAPLPERPDSVARAGWDWEGRHVGAVGWDPGVNPRISAPPGREIDFPSVEIDGRPFTVPQPPPPLEAWTYTSYGLFILDAPPGDDAEGAAIRVTRLDLAGDTVYDVTHPYTPVPYTSGALDSIAEAIARSGGAFRPMGQQNPEPDNWRQIAARLRAEMRFPEFRSPVEWGWADEDGRFWLRDSTSDVPGVRRWVRLSPTGEVDGAVVLGVNTRPVHASGGTLWVSENDELGVPWLVRYRLGG